MAFRKLSVVGERRAREAARKIVNDFGLMEPLHICIEDIAWALGLRVQRGALTGAAARLTVHNGRGVVRIRNEDADSPRGRFSLGHELGHFVLHKNRMMSCSDPDMANLLVNDNDEAQANVFAAELLMPDRMIRDRCEKMDPSFHAISCLADDFNVSLTSAALRTVDLCPASLALLFVKSTGVIWHRAGSGFKFWIDRQGPLGRHTVAARLLTGGLADGPEVVAMDQWLDLDGRDIDEAVELLEDVVVAPKLGGAFVLLQLTGLPDEDD